MHGHDSVVVVVVVVVSRTVQVSPTICDECRRCAAESPSLSLETSKSNDSQTFTGLVSEVVQLWLTHELKFSGAMVLVLGSNRKLPNVL